MARSMPEHVERGDGVVGAVGQPHRAVGADPAAVAAVVDGHHAVALHQRRVGGEPVGVGGHPEAVEEQHRRRARRRGLVADERRASAGQLERPARAAATARAAVGWPPCRSGGRGSGSDARHWMVTTSTVRVAPVGDVKSTLSPDLLAEQRLAERRPGADDVVLDPALLDGPVEVACRCRRRPRSGAPRREPGATSSPSVPSTISQFSIIDAELADPGLHLALVVLGGVVVAVLLEVAELPGGLDLAGDVDPTDRGELVVLGLEPVVGLLGEVVRLRHGRRGSKAAAAVS